MSQSKKRSVFLLAYTEFARTNLVFLGSLLVVFGALIVHLTAGQATTVMLTAEYREKEIPLLIYNIDTYVETGQILEILEELEVFLQEGDAGQCIQ